VEADSGVTDSLGPSTARVHDSQVWDEMLHGEETSVWADKGYVSAEPEDAFTGPGRVRGVMRKAPKGGDLHPLDALINRLIAMVRARVEPPFRVIQRQFGHVKPPLPQPCQEPRPALSPVRTGQPFSGATEADGMRTGLPEIDHAAARAASRPANPCPKPVDCAATTLERQSRRSRTHRSDGPQGPIAPSDRGAAQAIVQRRGGRPQGRCR